jgi:hypothetical protein
VSPRPGHRVIARSGTTRVASLGFGRPFPFQNLLLASHRSAIVCTAARETRETIALQVAA